MVIFLEKKGKKLGKSGLEVFQKNPKVQKCPWNPSRNQNSSFSKAKKLEDLSESDIDSDEDFGLNGEEFGPLSDTSSSDAENNELELGEAKNENVSTDEEQSESELPKAEESETDDETTDEEQSESELPDGEESQSDDEEHSGSELPEGEETESDDSTDEESEVANNIMPPDSDKYNEDTIFVGNIPLEAKKKDIEQFFTQYGPVKSVRLRSFPKADPKVSNKVAAIKRNFHKGCDSYLAFVRFVSVDSAKAALAANGSLFNRTHHLRVNSATEQSQSYEEEKAVFVGNLPFVISDEQIREIFADCGDISSIRVVRDKTTNIGKGFGFVNFTERFSVPLALEKHGQIISKRPIRVLKAVKLPKKSTVIERNQCSETEKSVLVRNLPFVISDEQVREIFSDCGNISNIHVVRDKTSNIGKGYGFVNFTDKLSVPLALKKNGHMVSQQPIRVMKTEITRIPKKSEPQTSAKIQPKNQKKQQGNVYGPEKADFQGKEAAIMPKKLSKRKKFNQREKEVFRRILNSSSSQENSAGRIPGSKLPPSSVNMIQQSMDSSGGKKPNLGKTVISATKKRPNDAASGNEAPPKKKMKNFGNNKFQMPNASLNKMQLSGNDTQGKKNKKISLGGGAPQPPNFSLNKMQLSGNDIQGKKRKNKMTSLGDRTPETPNVSPNKGGHSGTNIQKKNKISSGEGNPQKPNGNLSQMDVSGNDTQRKKKKKRNKKTSSGEVAPQTPNISPNKRDFSGSNAQKKKKSSSGDEAPQTPNKFKLSENNVQKRRNKTYSGDRTQTPNKGGLSGDHTQKTKKKNKNAFSREETPKVSPNQEDLSGNVQRKKKKKNRNKKTSTGDGSPQTPNIPLVPEESKKSPSLNGGVKIDRIISQSAPSTPTAKFAGKKKRTISFSDVNTSNSFQNVKKMKM